jgi:signal-transduction protein with cAMP-binding, CBS, and nucleotidyltransferase domain
METLDDVLEVKGDVVYRVEPTTTVGHAVAMMCGAKVGALLVLRDDVLAGIFSERDLIRRVVMAGRNVQTVEVGDVMTADVVCADVGLGVEEAMQLMTRARVRHLPVMRDGRLTGVVSMGDLVAWTTRERQAAYEQLSEYVAGRYPG